MKRKIFIMLLVISITASLIPTAALAAYTLPASFGAPEDLSVSYYSPRTDGDYDGFTLTVSAPKDLRAFVDDVYGDNSAFVAAGYSLTDIALQIDFKTEGGSWHANDEWNSTGGYGLRNSSIRISKGEYVNSTTVIKDYVQELAPGEKIQSTKYFDSHIWQFRARFMVTAMNGSGEEQVAFSPWSAVFSFSNNKTAEDPAKLINHAPVLKEASVKTYADGRPFLRIVTEAPHPDVTHLNNITGNSMNTEVWYKSAKKDWYCPGNSNFVEQFDVDAIGGSQADYTEYQVKIRYKFDYLHYPEAGKSGVIYSPFSNIISQGLPAYSATSAWAKTNLDKADSYGLIPASLRGADMTKPITREEFAELAVVLYEKTTGSKAVAASANPFKDTSNQEILKAFKLGITQGTSATTFSPKELTNREQVATMLSKAIRIMAPSGDFSTAGAPTFSDQKDISSWALEHVLFMAKMGIIKGSEGKFMPKAVTTAEKASGYATTTREQALVMSTRIYEKYKGTIKTKDGSVPKEQPSAEKPEVSGGLEQRLAGTWWVKDSGIHTVIVISFKSDGTFKQNLAVYSSISNYAETTKGSYKIDGDKITYYNQTYASAKGYWKNSALPGYEELGNIFIEGDLPAKDKTESISFTDDNHVKLGNLEMERSK
jgi:hypothetical protein